VPDSDADALIGKVELEREGAPDLGKAGADGERAPAALTPGKPKARDCHILPMVAGALSRRFGSPGR
jgi:hypothetical protein